jgi:L-malate glycosyltransferase
MQINQFVPVLSKGDATSNDALAIQSILRKNGYTSNIYAKFIDPRLLRYARPHFLYRGDSRNIAIYHFARGGLRFSDFVLKLPDSKVLKYHNITPPKYFEKYDDHLVFLCQKGLNELKNFKDHFVLGLGDSPFNCQAMGEAGIRKTSVLPISIDFSKYARYDVRLDHALRRSDAKKIIFVGRFAPNKKQDDIIRVFDYYNRKFNPDSRLYLIGQKQIRPYVKELETLVRDLGLSETVILTGKVSDKELNAYYRNADVFVCLSEHEGFCVPLVESMYFNVPVIAYNSSAIEDTLGKAGILLQNRDIESAAGFINWVIDDDPFRKALLEQQNRRLSVFRPDMVESTLLNIIREIEASKRE